MNADWQKCAVRDLLVGEHGTFVFEPGRTVQLPDVAATDLYLHIPFCRSLCPYCPYNRVLYDPSLVTGYVRALHREIERYRELLGDIEIGSIYIGGGTPTTLLAELGPVLEHLRRRFRHTGPVAVETIPDDLDGKTLETLRSFGVSLLSVGVQSFDDRYLRLIGTWARGRTGDALPPVHVPLFIRWGSAATTTCELPELPSSARDVSCYPQ